MAEPDHTVLARPSGLPGALFADLPGCLPDGAINDETMQRELRSAIAGIDSIRRVIACLLDNGKVIREASTRSAWMSSSSWAASDSTEASLRVAMHSLDECAGMLRHELHR